MHKKIISAAAAVFALTLSVFSASASDTPDSTGSKAVPIALLAVIFAAALISSTYITYRLRVKNLTHDKNTDKDTSSSTDDKES